MMAMTTITTATPTATTIALVAVAAVMTIAFTIATTVTYLRSASLPTGTCTRVRPERGWQRRTGENERER